MQKRRAQRAFFVIPPRKIRDPDLMKNSRPKHAKFETYA
jgi:hypothetical protein